MYSAGLHARTAHRAYRQADRVSGQYDKESRPYVGLIFSETVLLALTKKGMKREDAYRAVQSAAMKAWESHGDFRKVLRSDETVGRTLNDGELDELFELRKGLQSVDYIFQRVGLS